MKENDWTKSICDSLNEQNFSDEIHIDTLKKIPYAFEISHFNEEWALDADSFDKTAFETDLVIYEKTNGKIIPRVIIEANVKYYMQIRLNVNMTSILIN